VAADQALAVLDELAEKLQAVTEPLVLALLRRHQQLQRAQSLTHLSEIARWPSRLFTLVHVCLHSRGPR
jgi:hypothetical protein